MAKVSPCFYNEAGELLAPYSLDLKQAEPRIGGIPEKEPGFYYTFAFSAPTRRELAAKRRRFIDEMAPIPRMTVLSEQEYTTQLDSFVRHGIKLVYAIELENPPAIPHSPYWRLLMGADGN